MSVRFTVFDLGSGGDSPSLLDLQPLAGCQVKVSWLSPEALSQVLKYCCT